MRIVPEHYANALSDLWAQGPALIGLMFLFTPGFVTYRGGLLVGMMFPAYIAIGVLTTEAKRTMQWWSTYFVILACMEYLVDGVGTAFSWLPLFYHVKLLLIFWLQFPYFRGAQTLFNAFMCIFVPLNQRKEKKD